MEVFRNNYIEELDCYELELFYKEPDIDTDFRIELLDGDFLCMTSRELKLLKELLNSDEVEKLLD